MLNLFFSLLSRHTRVILDHKTSHKWHRYFCGYSEQYCMGQNYRFFSKGF